MQAVGYVRVSTNEQAISGLSLDAQRRKLEAQCEVSELQLIDVLTDAGQSATSLNRPGMQQLLALIRGGRIDAVVVTKLDRLTRNIADLTYLLDLIGRARRADGGRGVDLIAAQESIDTSTAAGRLSLHILASVSQWEREVIAERTSAALQELKAQGRATGGSAPFGYSFVNGRRVENADEKAIIENLSDLRAAGLSWQQIADKVNGAGKRTRRGGKWSKQGICHIAGVYGIA